MLRRSTGLLKAVARVLKQAAGLLAVAAFVLIMAVSVPGTVTGVLNIMEYVE